MPTANVSITSTYSQIAADTDTNLLVTFDTNAMVEFATTTTGSAPASSLRGHRLSNQDGISRTIIGPGFVWARTVPGLRPSSAQLVVTK